MRFNELLKDGVLRDGTHITLKGNVAEKDAFVTVIVDDATRMSLYDAYGSRTVHSMVPGFVQVAYSSVDGWPVSTTMRSRLVITLV